MMMYFFKLRVRLNMSIANISKFGQLGMDLLIILKFPIYIPTFCIYAIAMPGLRLECRSLRLSRVSE